MEHTPVENLSEDASAEKTPQREYIAVPMGVIPTGQKLEFNLYIPLDGRMVLYAAADATFEVKSFRSVRYNEITTLYARRVDPAYLRYNESNLGRILRDTQIPIQDKVHIYYSVATNLVKDILSDPRSGTAVKRSKEAVRGLVDMVLSQKDAFFNLVRLTSHDYYTYTHSVNVCTLAVGLARRLGIKSVSDYITLGLGALLHDVGKCTIDHHILNKPTALTEVEWKIMRKHPESGAEIISTPHDMAHKLPVAVARSHTAVLIRPDVSMDTLRAIEQHHEACNGRGYPHGLTEREIHLFAKIVKVVDIYDALTTNRCYQKAFTPFQAIKCIHETHLPAIDEKIFREFIMLLGYGPSR